MYHDIVQLKLEQPVEETEGAVPLTTLGNRFANCTMLRF